MQKRRRSGLRAQFAEAPFDNLFQILLLGANEPSHVMLQKKSERRVPIEDVTHERAAAVRMKLMNVTQALERAADHFIDEEAGAIDCNDPGRESLTQSEMPPFERHHLAQLQYP